MRNLKGQKIEDQQSLSSVPARPNSKKEMDNEKKKKDHCLARIDGNSLTETWRDAWALVPLKRVTS